MHVRLFGNSELLDSENCESVLSLHSPVMNLLTVDHLSHSWRYASAFSVLVETI